MIELPEAAVLSRQIREHLSGKRIRAVTVLQSPHRFAWFLGDPHRYPKLLEGKEVTGAEHHGGMVQMRLGTTSLLFYEGPSLRLAPAASVPKKHQLLLELDDACFLSVSIRMYGGIACFEGDAWDNPQYRQARERPSPLDRRFTAAYFRRLCDVAGFDKMSAKAFLATEQRVPGLGNGVLQDILFHAGIHPKRKMGTISEKGLERLRSAVTSTLRQMVEGGGRDTEKDLLGEPGGYRTILSRKTVGTPCPRCRGEIRKASYAGGSIYFCARCQSER